MNDSRRSCIVHQLPEYARDGYPPSYEYPLPAQIEPSSLAGLHPWLRHLAGLDPSEAHAALRARWDGLRDDALCGLRDTILECDTTSIVLTGPGAWLLCVNDNGGINLVAPQMDKESVNARLAACGMESAPLLADFLENFSGLREDIAPGGGCFIYEEEWQKPMVGWEKRIVEQVTNYPRWRDALIVFNSRGGDALLVHSSGRVGWWPAGDMEMRDAYDDLAECLVDFARSRHIPWPFDPYPKADGFKLVS
jgi:hypothetical protein